VRPDLTNCCSNTRHKCTRKVFTIFLVSFFLIIFAAPAYAYLDPATGAMIINIVLGAIAGAGLAIRAYWSKLTNFFGSSQKPDSTSDKDE
jgi:hypothetical protein